MKFKHFYPLFAAFTFSGLYGQVGINTANPQSTLDVVGNGVSTSTKDGVTAPRLTRQQLAAKVAGTYAAAQSGTLVYVTDAGTPTGTTPSLAQTANITKVGYYYFDGTIWKQISDTDSPSVNIYNSDGVIGGNRTVSQLANTLAFNATMNNAFSINRSSSANPLFSVDAANDRVGIATTAPRSRFEILSDNAGNGSGNDFNFAGYGSSKNPAILLSSAGGTFAAPINLVTGDLTGSLYFTGRANNTNVNSSISSAYRGDGTTALTDLMFATSNTERMRIDPTGNVGINTTAPVSELQVVGNELRLGGPSTQAGTVDSPILRIHSKANADGLGGSLLFNENNPGFGYYIKHNTGSGATGGLDGLAIGAIDVNTPARPAIFVSGGQAVGLGTATPQAVFHIDGAKDNNINSAPTVAQIANDIVVNTVGNLGIGSTAPTVKLDINSGGTPTTPITAVKIVDGNQGAGKILTSDTNGLATWQDAGTASVNLYNSDGTLGGNRIVSQSGNTLAFNGTVANAFSINRSTAANPIFTVDAANDRVGIGTNAPAHRLHVVSGAVSVNRFNLFDAASSTNQYGIVALRNTSALATGNYSLLLFTNSGPNSGGGNWGMGSIRTGATATNGTEEEFIVGNSTGGALNERMRITSTGNVGVGTNAPSNTLDVAGTARVRTINGIPVNEFITPVYADSDGVLVKPTSPTLYNVARNAVTVAAGATGQIMSGLTGYNRVTIVAGDTCGYSTLIEFYVIATSFNSNFVIKGIDGIFSGGSTAASKAITFNESGKTTTQVTVTGKSNCADGGNASALNYTITTPSAGVINITNDGNVSRAYTITVTRLN